MAKTFTQIYKLVENSDFGNKRAWKITDADLGDLDYSELKTLDSLVGRLIAFYTDLARRKVIDPNFKRPARVPDWEFAGAVVRYREFEERLRLRFDPSNRRFSTLWIIDPWIEAMNDAALFRNENPMIAEAVNNTMDLTATIIDARCTGKDWTYGDDGLTRAAYVSQHVGNSLEDQPMPAGSTEEQRQVWFRRMIQAIRQDNSTLPERIADALMTVGDANPDRPEPFLKRLQQFDGWIKSGLVLPQPPQTHSTPTSDKGHWANALWYWVTELTSRPRSVYSAYKKFVNGEPVMGCLPILGFI